MAIANITSPFGGLALDSNWANVNLLPNHQATAVNNLLYGPAGHQELNLSPNIDNYRNNPYAPPAQIVTQHRQRNNEQVKTYLPPTTANTRTNLEKGIPKFESKRVNYPFVQNANPYEQNNYPTELPNRETNLNYYSNMNTQYNRQQTPRTDAKLSTAHVLSTQPTKAVNTDRNSNQNEYNVKGTQQNYPQRPSGFTRVQAGQGYKTQQHAVLDYDVDSADEYYDEPDDSNVDHNSGDDGSSVVTPIQGPIYLKNGTVPIIPLYSYPTVNNGSFVQIPIWWTALSVALGLDVKGDVVRGVPCVKKYHQLFCPTAGNSYPIDRIERFIDENKALMRRMYGDFEMSTEYGLPAKSKKKRHIQTDHFDFDIPGVPDFISRPGYDPVIDSKGDSYFKKWRTKRQSQSTRRFNTAQNRGTQRTANENKSQNDSQSNTEQTENTERQDACESKVEIVTPYWASNSAGKIRAIVNTQHFEQAIHQEVCVKLQTYRCGGDCGCEQKYKWHRLLAYDPDNDCKGIFMDWFLFPSCCVCRCNP